MVAIDVAITNVVSLDSVRNSKMPSVADILFIW